MDPVIVEFARVLAVRAEKVRGAIEALRAAREAEAASVSAKVAEEAPLSGHAKARRELTELAEYNALRDYFTAGEQLREAIARAGASR
jgi:hypothetical protein